MGTYRIPLVEGPVPLAVEGEMSLRHHCAGNDRSWRLDRKPQDPSLRRLAHGPVQPMEEPGWIARLFGRRA